jgi:hypothetical protein
VALFVAVLFMGTLFTVVQADSGSESPIIGTAKLSEAEALVVAKNTYQGAGQFTDIELEMEGGVLVYAVEFTENGGNEVDVKIDAKTGDIVLMESDAEEAVDDDQGDVEEIDGDTSLTRMETLVGLLNQLLALLVARGK